jgi:mannose-6-phosphate isomerase-like protein (cupin superfamily)
MVSAGSANFSPARAYTRYEAAGAQLVRAGTYATEVGDEVITGWHSHDLHQIEYAFEGVAQVETATARYLLPPQQAVWIPAGVEHCSTLTHDKTVSVFFDPGADPRRRPGDPGDDPLRQTVADRSDHY